MWVWISSGTFSLLFFLISVVPSLLLRWPKWVAIKKLKWRKILAKMNNNDDDYAHL